MNFTKNSWHVKLNRKHGTNKAKGAIYNGGSISLCEYTNSTIYALLRLIVTVLVICAVCAVLVAGIFLLVLYPIIVAFCELANIPQFLVVKDVIFFALAVDLFIVLVAFKNYCKEYGFKVFPSWWPKALIPKSRVRVQAQAKITEPSIIIEWIKAKHAKICPMIQFKVEEKE